MFGDDEALQRLEADGVSIATISKDELRPGDVIVLPTDRGLLDRFGWAPESSAPVVDMSIVEYGVPLDSEAFRRLCGASMNDLIDRALGRVADDEDLDEDDRAEAIAHILGALGSVTPPGWEKVEWDGLMDALDGRISVGRNEVARLIRKNAASEPLSDELDEMCRAETAIELESHGRAVAARSHSIAERLGISADLAAVVERAGRFHDLGKADRRFQRWLDPDEQHPVLVAKSGMPRSRWNAARIVAGWPRGGRHEELSARLVRRWLTRQPGRFEPPLAELLVHLIISHHGNGRPLLLPADDQTTEQVSLDLDGELVEASADLSTIDWNQPTRFRHLNSLFGPWGLALLEAIVRRADHTVSAGAQVREMEIR